MRVIITGASKTSNRQREFVFDTLDQRFKNHPCGSLTIVHGAAPDGVDEDAAEWATAWGHTEEPWPAKWEQHGKRRNSMMVAAGAELIIGFPDAEMSTDPVFGTWGCLRLAAKAHIRGEFYPLPR